MTSSTDITSAPAPVSPPSKLAFLGETRALIDVGSVPFLLLGSYFTKTQTNNSLPIILFPGFASDERYMRPLGRYLENLGYTTEGWGLGVNLAGSNLEHALEDLSDGWNVEPFDGYSPQTYRGEGGVPHLCDTATGQVLARSKALQSPVILIGWSLGGYIAREVARDLPDQVAQVITLGAPVVGGPKYTRAASFFKAKGFDLDWIERESSKRDGTPIQQSITAIYSKSDAIVDWRAAVDKVSPNITHIKVKTSHLGMGFNRKVFKIVRAALQKFADGK